MDVNDIEKIIAVLRNTDVTEFEMNQDGSTVRIVRGPQQVVSAVVGTDVRPAIVNTSPMSAEVKSTPVIEDANLVKIESPIVGTFFRKPSPDAPAFAKVGDRVKKGDTICIIEAMKLMNEIESTATGTVEKIFLEDGHVVEYGELLFLVKPD